MGSPMKGIGSVSSVLNLGLRDWEENCWVRRYISSRQVVIAFWPLRCFIGVSKFPEVDNGDSWPENRWQVVEETGRLTKYSTLGKRGALPVKTDIV